MVDGLYRERPGADWREVEFIEVRPDGLVAREVGRVLPGIILAWADRFRVTGGVIEQPEILARNYVPAGISPHKWRLMREEFGRDAALALLAGPTVGVQP